MVLFSLETGQGRRVCDAHCYNAKLGSQCHCMCGGANHAVGEEKAIENSRTWLAIYGEAFPDLAVHPKIRFTQLTLIENVKLPEGYVPFIEATQPLTRQPVAIQERLL